jgi:citrate lyase subunit beta / citryl-CoA lyase
MPTETQAVQGALLFTPADRPDRFAKGDAASSGRLILDLEDAVAPSSKPAARAAVAAWFSEGHRSFVRINSPSTPFFAEDIEALGRLDITDVIVPKVESAEHVRQARYVWRDARIYPLVESALGLRNVDEIAKASGVAQLVFGALDLHADLGVSFPSAALLQQARITLALASRAAGIAPPIDTPHPAVGDPDAVARDAKDAMSCGFAAKLCIHPAQVAVVDEAFAPTDDELAWAREVVEAVGQKGVVMVRGRMVDAPVVLSARRTIARAGLRK